MDMGKRDGKVREGLPTGCLGRTRRNSSPQRLYTLQLTDASWDLPPTPCHRTKSATLQELTLGEARHLTKSTKV